MEQYSKWDSIQNGTVFKMEQYSVFKMEQYSKWNSIQTGTVFKMEQYSKFILKLLGMLYRADDKTNLLRYTKLITKLITTL